MPLAHGEDLPGSEEVERRPHAVRSLDKHIRVVVEGMIGGNEQSRAAGNRLLHVLNPCYVDLNDALAACQFAIDQWPPQPDKPRRHLRLPGARRGLKGLTIHGMP